MKADTADPWLRTCAAASTDHRLAGRPSPAISPRPRAWILDHTAGWRSSQTGPVRRQPGPERFWRYRPRSSSSRPSPRGLKWPETVRRYVREAKLRLGVGAQQVFIPCDPQIGVEAEVDWWRCIAILAGFETKLKLFFMRSKCSGKHFVRCYPCEHQQALFDGHIRGFSFFGGVFSILKFPVFYSGGQ